MERTRSAEGASDRELREELESVQSQLREARASLEVARGGGARAVEALHAAIAAERARHDELLRRREALAADQLAQRRVLEQLEEKLAAKREEDRVLALGAQRRDEYVDWNPGEGRSGRYADSHSELMAKFVIVGVFGLLVLVAHCV